MAPSKEAMEAAEKIVTVEKAVLGGYYVALCGTVVGISFPDAELATSGTKWYREQVATALDDHTADLRAEVEATKRELAYTEKSLKEVRGTNAEYSHAWQAIISAMLGNEFTNPKGLGGIQIADALRAERDDLRAEVEALRAERDELKAKVDAIESDKAKRFNRLREEFEEERKQIKADIEKVRKSLDY